MAELDFLDVPDEDDFEWKEMEVLPSPSTVGPISTRTAWLAPIFTEPPTAAAWLPPIVNEPPTATAWLSPIFTETPIQEEFMVNPFNPDLAIPESNPRPLGLGNRAGPAAGGPPIVVDPMINPWAIDPLTTEPSPLGLANGTEEDGTFVYRKFYISQAVIIPAILAMVFFSVLLVYVIVRHLRPVMKLYLSVIFYACSILFYASQIILLLLYDFVSIIIFIILR